MGSKRVDQVHKDLLSTDRKSRPEDEHIHEEDKHSLHETRGKLGRPKREDNPELADLKRKREAEEE